MAVQVVMVVPVIYYTTLLVVYYNNINTDQRMRPSYGKVFSVDDEVNRYLITPYTPGYLDTT